MSPAVNSTFCFTLVLQVDSAQFMEFSEVENHNDFYTAEDGTVHTQDQRGAFVMYDAALEDLQQLQDQLLLLTTLYIEKDRSKILYMYYINFYSTSNE